MNDTQPKPPGVRCVAACYDVYGDLPCPCAWQAESRRLERAENEARASGEGRGSE